MRDKQQSAVDWLIQELRGDDEKGDFIFNGVITVELINQAKELFKQQIIDAHCDGQSIEDTSGVSDAQQYFNETFKTESNGTT